MSVWSQLPAQCLSGNYTVGGVAPDYPDVVSAVLAVRTNGVCGPVVFSIRNGTYAGNLHFRNIPGASLANTVRFTSETGDSSQTILSFTLDAVNPIGLRIDTTSYVQFDHLTFNNAAPPQTQYFVYIRGMCKNITFANCVFNVPPGSITNLISTPSTNTYFYDLHLYNNKFENGYHGIYLQGHTATFTSRVEVLNNVFTDQEYMSVKLIRIDSLRFESNVVARPNAPYASNHLELAYIRDASAIINNRITGQGQGCAFNNMIGTGGDQPVIANNFIQAGGNQGSNTSWAVWSGALDGVLFVHNNLNLEGLTTGSPTNEATWVLGTYTATCQIQNNVTKNSGGGKVFHLISPPSSPFALDRNCWYTGGVTKFRYNSTNYNSLGAFSAASGCETTGIFQNPMYLSATDLHVQNGSLNNVGVSCGILVDIDGDVRSTPPDLGADEFVAVPNSVSAVSLPSVNAIFCAGNLPVEMVVQNLGSVAMTTCTFDWKVNNVLQPTLNWSGSIPPGATQLITLGNYNFVSNTAYTVTAWCSSPNGQTDPLLSDDTTSASTNGAGLSGTYIIGTAPSDYTTFAAACAALNTYGVCGPVTFNVKNGTYNESVQLNSIVGASSVNRIVFQSLAGDSTLVTLQSSAAQTMVVTFNGTRYVEFRDMRIQSQSLTNGKVFHLQNNAGFIGFRSCIIRNTQGASFSAPALVFGATNSTCDSMSFDWCILNGGSRAISIGNTVASQRANGLAIRNCAITNQSVEGITIQFQRNAVITDNTVSTTFLYISYVGMRLYNFMDTVRITGNQVYATYGDSYALELSGSAIAATNVCTIANNFLSGARHGLALNWLNSGVNLHHNSIRANSLAGYAAADFWSNTAWSVMNNIFCNAGSGTPLHLTYAPVLPTCYSNVYYAPNGIAVATDSPTQSLTLAQWQAFSGTDLNSYFGNPNYTSSSNLHITVGSPAGNHATPLAAWPRDIDGGLRSVISPDIGADEFIVVGNEAGLVALSPTTTVCNASTNVSVIFKNNGSTTLTSLTLNWKLNNVLQTPYVWTGSLSSDSTSQVVTIGSFLPVLATDYVVQAWLTLPNGNPDPYNVNDTLTSDTLDVGLFGTFTIGGVLPDFATIDAAFTYLETYGICAPVVLNVRDGEYVERCVVNPIRGTNAVNTITLQAESGDSSTVVIKNDTATYQIDPPLFLDTASFIVIRKLTFVTDLYPGALAPSSSSATPGDFIVIYSYSHDITIESCAFFDGQTRQNFTYPMNQCAVSIVPYWGTPYNIEIRNNYFFQGSAGVYSSGDTITIENNRFEDQFMAGIYLTQNNRELTIHGNEIVAQRYNAGYIPIWSQSLDLRNGTISANHIKSAYCGRAIFLNLPLSGSIRIFNNVIEVDSSASSATALIEVTGDTIIVCYNTVRVRAGASLSIAKLSGKSYVYNNSFSNLTGGKVYDLFYSIVPILNNNSCFTSGSTFGNINNASYATITAWRTALPGNETQSFSVNTLFQPNSPLIAGDTSLNNKAVPLVEIETDFFGASRDTLTPDIGAIEYRPLLLDVGVVSINDALLTCDGSHPVEVSLANYGTTTVTSMQVNWSVNGVTQSPYSWSGSITSGQTSPAITIGTFTSSNGTAAVDVWTSLPNGQTDSASSNDLLSNDPMIGPLSGTYTVGAAGDFSMLTDAFTALTQRGVCGPVQLMIMPGVYCESPTLTAVPGVSATDTILISSATGMRDVLFHRSINTVITAASCLTVQCDYVTLRSLSFDPAFHGTYTYPFGGLIVVGDYTRLDSCVVTGSQFYPSMIISTFNKLNCQFRGPHIEMKNCWIHGWGNGLWVNGNQVAPAFGYTEGTFTNNIVEGNSEIRWLQTGRVEGNTFAGSLYTVGFIAPVIINKNHFNALTLDADGTPADSTRITNNFFDRGLTLTGDYILVANNTFTFTSLGPWGGAAFTRSSTQTKVINNIFHAEPSIGPCRNDVAPNTGLVSDYNVYWVRNNPSTAASVLTNLQGLGYDNNSVVINPMLGITDFHTQNALFSGQGIPVAGLTDDIDGDIRPANPAIGADEIAPPAFQVWPGNANNDTVVDNFDLLPIGVHTGSTGPSRWTTSISWQGYLALDWSTTQANGQDLKHVDCNGDSTINSIDTTAVSINYGLIDPFPIAPPPFVNNYRVAPPIYITTNQSVYAPGDLVIAEVWAGDSANPFIGVYGVGFHVAASDPVMGPSGMDVAFTPNWLGTAGADLYSIDRTHAFIGRLDGSIVRFDHTSRSGYGKIADITFRIDSSLTTDDTVELVFPRLEIIDSTGALLPYSTPVNTFIIDASTLTVEEPLETLEVAVYPNPIGNNATILINNTNSQNVRVELFNSLGERVSILYDGVMQSGVQSLALSRENFEAAGVYQVMVSTENSDTTVRILVQ